MRREESTRPVSRPATPHATAANLGTPTAAGGSLSAIRAAWRRSVARPWTILLTSLSRSRECRSRARSDGDGPAGLSFDPLVADTLRESLGPEPPRRRIEIPKPVTATRPLATKPERRRAEFVLAADAPTALDPVTRLPDGVYLDRVLSRAIRSPNWITLALLVIEPCGLDRVRSKQGPVYADAALHLVARAVKATLRGTDVVVRLDKNRLAAVLAGASLRDAQGVAQVLRRAIDEAGLTASTPKPLTARIGIAAAPDHATTVRELRELAVHGLRRSANTARWN